MAKVARKNETTQQTKILYGMAAAIVVLLAFVGVLFFKNDQKNATKTVATSSNRTCEQWRGDAELPLKISSTEPSQFTGQELIDFVNGGYNYVYYFIADGSQKDAVGKPFAVGGVVFSAPNYFTKDISYIDYIKPSLDEISNSSAADAKRYLAGENFKNIVLNSVNTYNQSHQRPIDELCAKFAPEDK